MAVCYNGVKVNLNFTYVYFHFLLLKICSNNI